MNTINFETSINAPKEKVWEILADFSGIRKWAPSVTNSTLTTSNNSGPGCERSCEIQNIGSIRERVAEWNEGEGYKVEVATIPGTPVKSGFTSWLLRSKGNQTIARILSYFELMGTEEEKNVFLEDSPQLLKSSLMGLKRYAETGQRIGTDDLHHMTGTTHN
ncbi:MAG: SRPBCC family protein [Nitrososphaeraceae archaeon]